MMLSPANSEFEMAKGRQIEVGLKQGFWQEKGEWTLAAYHIKKTNLLTRDASDPSRRVQVGEQSSPGIEASMQLEFARSWTIQAKGTLLRARLAEFAEPDGEQKRVGE